MFVTLKEEHFTAQDLLRRGPQLYFSPLIAFIRTVVKSYLSSIRIFGSVYICLDSVIHSGT